MLLFIFTIITIIILLISTILMSVSGCHVMHCSVSLLTCYHCWNINDSPFKLHRKNCENFLNFTCWSQCLTWQPSIQHIKLKKGQIVPVYTMKAYRRNRGLAPLIFNLAFSGSESLALCLGHFTPPGRNLNTHWIGGWMVSRAVLDTLENRKSLSFTGIQTCSL
jgi:hypothetical protein